MTNIDQRVKGWDRGIGVPPMDGAERHQSMGVPLMLRAASVPPKS